MSTLTNATLGDLLPFALGMALSPQAMILALLWLTTHHGRMKALVLLAGIVASTAAALLVLVQIDWQLRAPIGAGRLKIAAGIFALAFGLYCLTQVAQGLARVTRGKATLGELRPVRGLAEAFEHASWGQVFARGAKASILAPRAPQSLVPSAIIISLQPLKSAQELAVILAFSGVVGLGVIAVLAIALLPGRCNRRWLFTFRDWMAANGGFVVLGANALLAAALLWEAFRYLH